MKKAFYKNAAAFGIVVGLWVLYSMMTADFIALIEGLTAVVFITLITILAVDAMEKAFTDPSLFTWQYLVGAAFILVCSGLWLFFAACETWLQFALRGILMMAAAGGTFCWFYFFYGPSVLTEDERLVRLLSKIYRKAAKTFPQLDDEGVKNALKETLFCRLEGDTLEGALLTDKPFVPGYRTYKQISDSSDLSAQEKSAALTNIASYINTLVARRATEGKSVSSM